MKVYCVTERHLHVGDNLLRIFDSEEKAQDFLREQAVAWNERLYFSKYDVACNNEDCNDSILCGCSHSYQITEMEVE